MTQLQVNAILVTAALTGIVSGFIVVGEYCTAGALAGSIALVAQRFAGDKNGKE